MVELRRCAVCGASLAGKRPSARTCSDRCRDLKRKGHRLPAGALPPVVVEMHPDPLPDAELMSLEQLARELQGSIRSPLTLATAKAGLAREYRTTLAEIEARKPPPPDAIDELFERRARRA